MEINGKKAFQEQLFDRDGKRRAGNIYCFWWETKRNDIASKKLGRPVYDRILRSEIRSPGLKTQIHTPEIEIHYTDFGTDKEPLDPPIERVRARMSGILQDGRELTMRESLKQFLDAWEGTTAMPEGGTPLEAWPRTADVSLVASLKESGIYTVENLADLPDSRLGVLPMGGRDLREQAKVFIAAAKGSAEYSGIIAQNVELTEQVKILSKQMAEIRAMQEAQDQGNADPTEPRRGPGRPPKQQVA